MSITKIVPLKSYSSMNFFFKQKTAYEIASCLVGSEMCIRDRTHTVAHSTKPSFRSKTNNQPLKKFLSLALS